MSPKNRRLVAMGLTLLYVAISATFELSHVDYVPLDSRRVLTSADPIHRIVDEVGGDFVCPAHTFAQSTHSSGVNFFIFASHEHFSFLQSEEHLFTPSVPHHLSRTRAPPQS